MVSIYNDQHHEIALVVHECDDKGCKPLFARASMGIEVVSMNGCSLVSMRIKAEDDVGGKKLYAVPGPYFADLLSFWLTLTHPQHPTFLSNFPHFFYFPCQNALVRKLPNCSHSLCTRTSDSGLGLSKTSNTGNFQYHKYRVSQEPVMQTLAIHISTESY